jgi:hypothetical protein
MSDRSFKKNSNRFLKWLKKNRFKIYDSDTFNTFSELFHIQSSYENRTLDLCESDLFVTRHWPRYSSFVLLIRDSMPIGQFGYIRDYGAELLKHDIGLVVVHNYTSLRSDAFGTALCISNEHLFEDTTTFVCSHTQFEENLNSYLGQKEEILRRWKEIQ